MQYNVQIRSKRSVGSSSHAFGGPDTYVAVTIAPDNAIVPYTLNSRVLAKRGITLKYFGEGYREHQGPKSMLGMAIRDAEEFCNANTRA